MKSHELFRELLQDSNAKQLADQMKLSTSIIYKWAEPSSEGGSGTPNPLDRVSQLMDFTDATNIAQWVCEQAGGFYVKNPSSPGIGPVSVITATNQIVQEFAEMLSLVATAALDNSITKQEARILREQWEDLKSVTEEYVTHCEQGNFKEIRDRKPKNVRKSKKGDTGTELGAKN